MNKLDLRQIKQNGASNGQVLTWSNSSNAWVASANVILNVATTSNLVTNNAQVDGNIVVSGNLTVSGTTTYINTTTLNIGDNIITLNADVSGSPSENAGIEVNRGTSDDVSVRWNESTDKWEFTNDGTTYVTVASNTDVSTAYSNAVSNAASYTDTVAGTAYSNAVSTAATDATNKAANAYSNAVSTAATDATNKAANAYSNATAFAANATNISSGTLSSSRLPTSGVVANAYGNATAIPVLTIDATGRITNASTTSVSGVTGVSYTPSNSTIVVSTSISDYPATINSGNSSTSGLLKIIDSVANTSDTIAASANSVKTAYDAAISAYSNATSYAANATNISSGTLNASRLPASGVTANTYGNTTAIPVLTIDTAGRITNATYSTISSDQLISGNNTVTLDAVGDLVLPANSAISDGTTALAANTADQVIDSYDKVAYRTAKYTLQAISGADVHSTEVLVTHNDDTAFITEYATVYTNTSLMVVNASVSTTTVSITASPTNTNTTISFIRNTIVAGLLAVGLSSLQGDLNTLTGTEDLASGSGTLDLNA